MVTKMKQERSLLCDSMDKDKKSEEKLLRVEERYKALKIQLNNKDSEITGYIVENKKLMKKISELQKPKDPEYFELSD